jgi:tetratricopeptide (TPR) repeat protein
MKARMIISLLAILVVGLLRAQTDPLVEALRQYQAGNLKEARGLIDQAVKDAAHAEDPEAWLLRGFVYKDVFKDMPAGQQADMVRDEAVASLYTCIMLDTEGMYRDNATQAHDFVARTYFNDAAKALASQEEVRAMMLFERYKEAVLRLDPQANLRPREVEFHNALGTAYTKRFNEERTVQDWFDKAVDSYERVLKLEPGNYGANYNLATLYYNRGVFNIRNIGADDDIPSIQQIQEASREYFQEALPYMLKAHEMNPQRRETLLGLEGIYYSLQDMESSERYRMLYEALPPE